MDLAAVMDLVGDRLATIDGLRVHRYPADSVTPPAAVVAFPDDLTFDAADKRGMDRITLPVVVIVGRMSDRAARDNLATYCHGSSVGSIKAAVESISESTLRLPGTEGARATTPDDPALDITGDLDVRLDAALDQWTGMDQALVGRLVAGGSSSWLLDVLSNGHPRLRWSDDGGGAVSFDSATEAVPAADGERIALRAVLDVDDGNDAWTVTYYTAPTLDGPWTQLGDQVTGSPATQVHASGEDFELGTANNDDPAVFNLTRAPGDVHGLEIRPGFSTPVADPDFTTLQRKVTGFTDQAGRTWTIHGDAHISAQTVFDTVRVQSAEFDAVQMAGIDYLAATFTLDIAGKGTT